MDCRSINIFAQRLTGEMSVLEKASAVLNESYR